ncbi:MAG: TraB/GumN family protein [Oscillospiraceae bacterium]|nr:TraB/GumN family protein [Oscillospiraceae bacterium]
MKYKAKLLTAVLCVLLALCCGCQQTPAETTAPTAETTHPTTAPTEPPAQDVYAEAVEKLNATENLLLRVSGSYTIEVGGESFTSQTSQVITHLGFNTDSPRSSLKENSTHGEKNISISEICADGKLYTTIDGVKFITQPEEGADPLDMYMPAVLLDGALYESVTLENGVLTFSQPTALESWIAPEEAELIEASGTAAMDANRMLTEATYDAVYQYGPSKITEHYKLTYGTPNTTEIAVPEDTSEYITSNAASAVSLYTRALGYLAQSSSISSTVLDCTISQAAGVVGSEQVYADIYRVDDAPMYRVKQSGSQGSTKYEVNEIFRDGVYTASTDGSEPEANPAVTAQIMDYALMELLWENCVTEECFADVTLTDTGTLYLLEADCTEELAKDIKDEICYELFQNVLALDDLASEYKLQHIRFYFSIDKYTGLPVAMGLHYEGKHIIEGKGYTLSRQYDKTFEAPSQSAYKNITEEDLPETEPENKATPLLYHVTGTNGQEMWLFGTIHVGDARTAYLPQALYDAFDGSDALAIECDTDAFYEKVDEDERLQNLVSMSYYYMATTAEDHIDTPELYDHAVQLMKATGNYYYNTEQQKLSLWSSSIDNFYLAQGRQLSSDKGAESRLTKRAEEKNIPIWEVESTLFQIQMMTGYSEKLQEFLLYSSVASNGQESWEGTWELYEKWCAGDEAALIEYLTDEDAWELAEEDFDLEALSGEELDRAKDIISRLDEINAELATIQAEYNTAMEGDRNAGMLDVAKGYLESGDVVFYAVGLAHLLAEDGLVNTLRDAGYTVELVTYA